MSATSFQRKRREQIKLMAEKRKQEVKGHGRKTQQRDSKGQETKKKQNQTKKKKT